MSSHPRVTGDGRRALSLVPVSFQKTGARPHVRLWPFGEKGRGRSCSVPQHTLCECTSSLTASMESLRVGYRLNAQGGVRCFLPRGDSSSDLRQLVCKIEIPF